jgi:hypothetical protein
MADEERALSAEPVIAEPVISEKFDVAPDWSPAISPLSPNPFTVKDGILSVTARAHTHAFLTRNLIPEVHGFVAKLRQNTDGGMSWGPAVQLRWKNGARLRVGLRSDGLVQSDMGGEQRVFERFDPKQWTWLRVRWEKVMGVIELSDDGAHWRKVGDFTHAGGYCDAPLNISIGKVPYNGEPTDLPETDAGATGTSEWDELVVY